MKLQPFVAGAHVVFTDYQEKRQQIEEPYTVG